MLKSNENKVTFKDVRKLLADAADILPKTERRELAQQLAEQIRDAVTEYQKSQAQAKQKQESLNALGEVTTSSLQVGDVFKFIKAIKLPRNQGSKSMVGAYGISYVITDIRKIPSTLHEHDGWPGYNVFVASPLNNGVYDPNAEKIEFNDASFGSGVQRVNRTLKMKPTFA